MKHIPIPEIAFGENKFKSQMAIFYCRFKLILD